MTKKRQTKKKKEDFLGGLLTERDGFAAVNDAGGICAWLRLPSGSLLEVQWIPGNYPGLTVSETHISNPDLARHIREHLEGWHLIRDSLGLCVGVDGDGGIISGVPTSPWQVLVTGWSQLNVE